MSQIDRLRDEVNRETDANERATGRRDSTIESGLGARGPAPRATRLQPIRHRFTIELIPAAPDGAPCTPSA